MKKTILSAAFALLSLTACEKTLITAPQVVQEDQIPFREVNVGDGFVTGITIPVTDPTETLPVATIDIKNGLLTEINSDAYTSTELYTGVKYWNIQFVLTANTVGTETITIKLSNRPNMIWTQKIVVKGSQKG